MPTFADADALPRMPGMWCRHSSCPCSSVVTSADWPVSGAAFGHFCSRRFDQVLITIRTEWRHQGREQVFDELRDCLLGTRPRGGYAETAARLAMSEGAVKTAVHRLRRRFQTELQHRVAETLSEPDDADDEIRSLIRALHA